AGDDDLAVVLNGQAVEIGVGWYGDSGFAADAEGGVGCAVGGEAAQLDCFVIVLHEGDDFAVGLDLEGGDLGGAEIKKSRRGEGGIEAAVGIGAPDFGE